MGAAGFGGSFAPIVQHEKWEIHPVFPHFPYFRSGQNLSPNLLAPLCGVALILFAAKAANSARLFLQSEGPHPHEAPVFQLSLCAEVFYGALPTFGDEMQGALKGKRSQPCFIEHGWLRNTVCG